MTPVVDGRRLAVNLDAYGMRRPKMSPAGIMSVVLLCIAIVVVVGYLIKLGVAIKGNMSLNEVPTETQMSVIPAVPAFSAVPAFYAAPVVAVGAAVADTGFSHPVNDHPSNELPYLEATGAAASSLAGIDGPQAAETDSQLGNVGFFGDLVPANQRMEAPSASASLNLGAVMPSSWRDAAAGAPESESDPFHDYFTPFGSESEADLKKEHPRWAELRLSREATKRAIENIPAVDRLITLRPANKVGIYETAALRPATKAPMFTQGVHVFQDSQARQETVSLAMQGVYPQERLGYA
jgi:hypothetical protein